MSNSFLAMSMTKPSFTQAKPVLAIFVAAAFALSSASPLLASSHREAPLIAADPKADVTDFYAFVSPDKSDTVTFIANYLPFQEPAGGPNFYTFDDNVMYEIKVDSDGDATEDTTFQFRFTTTVANPNTFLYNTGPVTSLDDTDLNVKQTYSLTQIKNGVSTVLKTGIKVPPSNIGPTSTPNYANLQAEAVTSLGNGMKVFAGQSDDPFYADLGGLFDLLTIRKLPGNAGGGVDGLKGYNVNSLVLQVPITMLTSDGSKPTDVADKTAVIGSWTTASRQTTRVLSSGSQTNAGSWVQVSRLGAPLVNEVVVPLGAKDIWNGSKPSGDAQFANGVTDPELGKLLNALYGIKVPPQGAFGSAEQRDDLIAIFLTGIPGLTQSEKGTPAEELRLNVAVAPASAPNNLGVVGGDNAGYPNGRRLADDVTDISIKAVAGAAYPLFHPDFTPDPLAAQLGDGVASNDVSFRTSFPYLALPHAGFDSVPHGSMVTTTPAPTPAPTPGMPVMDQPNALYRLYSAKLNKHFYTASITERDGAMKYGYTFEGTAGSVSPTQAAGTVALYRLYNTRTNAHVYTTSATERDSLTKSGFMSEGITGYVYADFESGNEITRLFNARSGDYFYTANAAEATAATKSGYVIQMNSWVSF